MGLHAELGVVDWYCVYLRICVMGFGVCCLDTLWFIVCVSRSLLTLGSFWLLVLLCFSRFVFAGVTLVCFNIVGYVILCLRLSAGFVA